MSNKKNGTHGINPVTGEYYQSGQEARYWEQMRRDEPHYKHYSGYYEHWDGEADEDIRKKYTL